MREDITLAHFNQGKLCVVAVRREIFQAVTSCTKQTKCLEEVFVILGVLVSPSQVDGFAKEIPDESRGGCDAEIFRSDVIFHTITFVNGQLPPLVDRTAESPVVLSGIDVVGVVFGVVDVLFRAVTSKPLAGYLELAGAYNVVSAYAVYEAEMSSLPYPKLMNPSTQSKSLIASALTYLTVPTSIAWE
jgi:hypothetical protein